MEENLEKESRQKQEEWKVKRTTALIALIAVMLAAASCGLFHDEKREATRSYETFLKAVSERNCGEIWNSMAYESQRQYESFIYKPSMDRVRMVSPENKKMLFPGTKVSIESMERMTPKEFFEFQLTNTGLIKDIESCFPVGRKVESVEIAGDSATLKMESVHDKNVSDKIPMRMENGRWRIVFFPPGDIKR